ncbi:MAG: metallophosphoesterase [Spirochaetaceae bacterium]|jgi:predicted MPP superfamily phosphohydrolase|nr:metallophosphoesterase [Spirochaetaceae bacterium]
MWLLRSALAICIYAGLNLYIGARIFICIRFFLPGCKALVFWPLYALFACSFVLVFVFRLEHIIPLRQAGMYSIAAFVYLFLTLAVSDIARIGIRIASRAGPDPRLSALLSGAALCLSFFILVYGAFHARDIKTRHYSLSSDKTIGVPSLRVALISDLHLGAAVGRKWTARIVNAVNKAEPDLVCIAGDIFDGGLELVRDMDGIASELRRIKAPLGVYACPGNHDVDRARLNEDPTGIQRIAAFLKDSGVILLLDETAPVADRLYITGRKDARPIGLRQPRKTIAELPSGPGAFLILLDHQPLEFTQAAAAGTDLVLSGHTHKGQFFPGNLITRRIFKHSAGTHYGHWQNGATQAIVTSGAGLWGPPIRVATDSEVAVIDIRFGE